MKSNKICFVLLLLAAARGNAKASDISAAERVQSLLKDLNGSNTEMRIMAADALGLIGPVAVKAIPSLYDAMRGRDRTLQSRAAVALGKIGPSSVDSLLMAFTDRSPYVRALAAKTIVSISPVPNQAVGQLKRAMQDKNEGVRLAAVQALAQVKDVHSISPILDLVRCDDSLEVRFEAVFAIQRFGPEAESAIPCLIDLIKDPKSFKLSIRKNMETWPPTLDVCAASALARLGGPGVRSLISVLVDPKNARHTRLVAGEALTRTRVDGPQLVPDLVTALNESDDEIRVLVARILSDLAPKDDGTIAKARLFINDPDLEVRFYIARLLRRVDRTSSLVIPALISCVKEEKSGASWLAATELESLGSAGWPAIGALMKMLEYTGEYHRVAAAKALGSIGPRAFSAVAALEKMEKVGSELEKREAADAIQRIRRPK